MGKKKEAWCRRLGQSIKRQWNAAVEDFTTTDWIATAISVSIAIVALIWWGSIGVELISNFKQLNSDVYFNYIQVALQLFAISLVGGIFEHSSGKVPAVVKKLFTASLLFLVATIGFLFLNASRYFNPEQDWLMFITGVLIIVAFTIGSWAFVEGCIKLLLVLTDYRNKILGTKTRELEKLHHPSEPLRKKKT